MNCLLQWCFKFKPGRTAEVCSAAQSLEICLNLPEVATILEGLWNGKASPKFACVPSVLLIYWTALHAEERDYLRAQILELRIQHVPGSPYELDPSRPVCASQDQPRARQAKQQPNLKHLPTASSLTCDKVLGTLKKAIGLGDLVNRLDFPASRHVGLLHVGKSSAYFLMDSEQHCAQSSLTCLPDPTKTNRRELLVIVKVALTAQGQVRNCKEAEILGSFQETSFAPKLYKMKIVQDILNGQAIVTEYFPSTLQLEPISKNWISLSDVEDITIHMLNAIALIHQKGFCFFHLTREDVLLNPQYRHPMEKGNTILLTGLGSAIPVGTLLASSEGSDSYQYQAPETKRNGYVANSAADMWGLGLYLKSLLMRDITKQLGTDISEACLDEIIRNFNVCIFGSSLRLTRENWLILLIVSLMNNEPELRPTAVQALTGVSRRPDPNADLVLGATVSHNLPGFLEPFSGRFIWPVSIEQVTGPDTKNAEWLTHNCTVKALVDTPKRSAVCYLAGRPTSKRCLKLMRFLGLHSHGYSIKGTDVAWDGRRVGNGIFDLNYYICTLQVCALHLFIAGQCNNTRPSFLHQAGQLIDTVPSDSKAQKNAKFVDLVKVCILWSKYVFPAMFLELNQSPEPLLVSSN